jgi:NADPH-dependent ferric siderophore reductase
MDDFARSPEFDAAIVSVWNQALVDKSRSVTVEGASYTVRHTAKHGLAQVDFKVGGRTVRGLEQNPQTASRWAQTARNGAKVMQFLDGGRYLAVVADGKITHYGGSRKGSTSKKK